jgi:hypothetical protein
MQSVQLQGYTWVKIRHVRVRHTDTAIFYRGTPDTMHIVNFDMSETPTRPFFIEGHATFLHLEATHVYP